MHSSSCSSSHLPHPSKHRKDPSPFQQTILSVFSGTGRDLGTCAASSFPGQAQTLSLSSLALAQCPQGMFPHFTRWNYFTECNPTTAGDAPYFWAWLKSPCHPLLTHPFQSGQIKSETLLISRLKHLKLLPSWSRITPRFLSVHPMGWAGVEPSGNLRPGPG